MDLYKWAYKLTPPPPRASCGRLLRARRGCSRTRHAGQPARPRRPLGYPAGADRDPGRRAEYARPGRLPAGAAPLRERLIDLCDDPRRRWARCDSRGTGSPSVRGSCAEVDRRKAATGGHEQTRFGRRRRRRRAAPAARTCGPPGVTPAGRPPARAGTGGVPLVHQAPPQCAARRAAGCRPSATPPPPPGRSPADPDHRLDEPVQLRQVLALGRLHHQRARHRERHRRRVEAVVDQPLGHVVDGHPGRLRDRPQIEDALVGAPPPRPLLRRRRAPGSARAAGPPRSSPPAPPSPWPAAARPTPSAAGTPTGSAGCPPTRAAPPTPAPTAARRRASGSPGRNGARCARTATGPTPGRHRRAGCRRSCAGSGATRRRRTCPGLAKPEQRVEVRTVHVDLAAGLVHLRAELARSRSRTRRASTGRSP